MWDALEKKYKSENVGSKMFVIGRFLDYRMVDTRSVVEQVEEFQMIVHSVIDEQMPLLERFIAGVMIEKLPQSWSYFKHGIKHELKEVGLEDLIVRIRIEEDNRKQHKPTARFSK